MHFMGLLGKSPHGRLPSTGSYVLVGRPNHIRVHPLKHASAWHCRIIGNHCDWNAALTKVCDWKLTWIQIMYRLTRARRRGCYSVLRIQKNTWWFAGMFFFRPQRDRYSYVVCESMRHSCMLVPPNPYTYWKHVYALFTCYSREGAWQHPEITEFHRDMGHLCWKELTLHCNLYDYSRMN